MCGVELLIGWIAIEVDVDELDRSARREIRRLTGYATEADLAKVSKRERGETLGAHRAAARGFPRSTCSPRQPGRGQSQQHSGRPYETPGVRGRRDLCFHERLTSRDRDPT